MISYDSAHDSSRYAAHCSAYEPARDADRDLVSGDPTREHHA